MKNLYLKTILLFLICFISYSSTSLAQSVSVANNYPSSLIKPATGTISTQLERSTDVLDFLRTFTWSVSPSIGASLSGTGSTRTLTFTNAAAVGTYTVTVTGNSGWGTATTTVTLTDGTSPAPNIWAAKSIGANTSRVEGFNFSGMTVNSGPSTLFYTGGEFAALGRSPLPVGNGNFYWIPYSAGNNGILTVIGVDGNGGSQATVVSSFDIAPGNDDATFIRLAMDKNGVGWTLTSIGGNLNLTKIPFSGLSTVTPVIEDVNVTLAGGSVSTFQNGDLCLDGAGYIYALANISSSTTEIYIGMPAGASTVLTRKWIVKDAAGNDFTGSVNGCAFDAAGAMYISTANGIYYLDPGTIAPGGPSGPHTVRARLVSQQSDYTDLGSNLFPNTTTIPLPARFGTLTATEQNGSVVINWETLMEKDVKEFVIEASKDGKEWHEIGRVSSKAPNGNSDNVQSYEFIASSSLALGALSLALLLLIPVFRSRLLKAALGIVVIMIVAVACNKQSDVVVLKKSDTAFIRIAQYDIGSDKPTYSKTISVVKQ